MPVRPIPDDQIGGGFVRRSGGISAGGMKIPNGTKLSREWILSIPRGNRQALVNNEHIALFPLADAVERKPSVRAERMVHKQASAAL